MNQHNFFHNNFVWLKKNYSCLTARLCLTPFFHFFYHSETITFLSSNERWDSSESYCCFVVNSSKDLRASQSVSAAPASSVPTDLLCITGAIRPQRFPLHPGSAQTAALHRQTLPSRLLQRGPGCTLLCVEMIEDADKRGLLWLGCLKAKWDHGQIASCKQSWCLYPCVSACVECV